jgi:hypothetical protein
MNPQTTAAAALPASAHAGAQTTADTQGLPGCKVNDLTIPELVAEVFVAAPPEDRGHLLEELLRPLGILSLFGVAGGIFANAKLHGGWHDLHIRLEDIRAVRAADVVALADYAEQISVEIVGGLARMLAASPLMTGSAAAVLLVTLLLQRTGGRPGATLPQPN